jgi:hypothetical protein
MSHKSVNSKASLAEKTRALTLNDSAERELPAIPQPHDVAAFRALLDKTGEVFGFCEGDGLVVK